jgi:hypothetical protein
LISIGKEFYELEKKERVLPMIDQILTKLSNWKTNLTTSFANSKMDKTILLKLNKVQNTIIEIYYNYIKLLLIGNEFIKSLDLVNVFIWEMDYYEVGHCIEKLVNESIEQYQQSKIVFPVHLIPAVYLCGIIICVESMGNPSLLQKVESIINYLDHLADANVSEKWAVYGNKLKLIYQNPLLSTDALGELS